MTYFLNSLLLERSPEEQFLLYFRHAYRTTCLGLHQRIERVVFAYAAAVGKTWKLF